MHSEFITNRESAHRDDSDTLTDPWDQHTARLDAEVKLIVDFPTICGEVHLPPHLLIARWPQNAKSSCHRWKSESCLGKSTR